MGGEGKVFISASSAVGEGCDPTIIPSLRTAAMLCGDQVLVCTPGRCGNRGGPTPSQTDRLIELLKILGLGMGGLGTGGLCLNVTSTQ